MVACIIVLTLAFRPPRKVAIGALQLCNRKCSKEWLHDQRRPLFQRVFLDKRMLSNAWTIVLFRDRTKLAGGLSTRQATGHRVTHAVKHRILGKGSPPVPPRRLRR